MSEKLINHLSAIEQQLRLKPNSALVVEVSELVLKMSSFCDNPLSEENIFELRSALHELRLGSEPNISKRYRKIELSDKIAIFKLDGSEFLDINYYIREKIFFSVLVMIAKSDKDVSADELDYIEFCKKFRSIQSHISLGRLTAIIDLAFTKPKQDLIKGLKNLLKHYPDFNSINEFLIKVIISDGYLDVRELFVYCEIAEILTGNKPTLKEAREVIMQQARTSNKQINKKPVNEKDKEIIQELTDFDSSIIDEIFSEF